MLQITDLTREKYDELRSLAYDSSKQQSALRTLMLNILADAYESDEYIHPIYFYRANNLLSYATNDLLRKNLTQKERILQ